jgi:hypothetical protein
MTLAAGRCAAEPKIAPRYPLLSVAVFGRAFTSGSALQLGNASKNALFQLPQQHTGRREVYCSGPIGRLVLQEPSGQARLFR